MKKKFCFFCLIVLSPLAPFSQDMDIFLIEGKSQIYDSCPGQIKMGVVVARPVYFKLTKDGTIVRGSIFEKGLNIFEIESVDFFQNPGTHDFVLVTKNNQKVKKRKILITTRFIDKFEPSTMTGPETDKIKIEIPGQNKNPGPDIGPLNPYTHRYENLDSINLFGIVSKLIKKKKQASMRKKLAEIRSRATRCRQMVIGFYPDNQIDQVQPVYVSVTLEWTELPEKE